MTYFGFLIGFVGVPLVFLAFLTWRDWRRKYRLPSGLNNQPGWLVLLLHVILAVVWTTPWDNYLVASGVWFYNPELVTGITIGWVPIEEYTFFVVQTLMTGLWLLWLGRHRRVAPMPAPWRPRLRWISGVVAGAIWVGAVAVLLAGWRPGTYLGLELAWMLPPIILQLAVGADVLWHQRRLVALALLPPMMYLVVADALAINSGTWTIAPAQTTGVMLRGVLPLEELIFFGLTNVLIVFGMTLFLAIDKAYLKRLAGRSQPAGVSSVN
jgi:lycopene beta-cyclase